MAKPVETIVRGTRAATPADISGLVGRHVQARLTNLRDSHHNLARAIASGMTNVAAARYVGYSESRIFSLKKDPTFNELVEKYRQLNLDKWLESRDQYYETMSSVGIKAWRMIEDTLDAADEANEPIAIDKLVRVGDSVSDRIGYMKKSMNFNANVDFAKNLEEAIARQQKFTPAIEHKPESE